MNDELSAMHDRALQAEQELIEARNYRKDEVARLEDEIATLKACKMGVDDTIKEVLRQAIMVVAYRAGDISTEDGSYATTCTDSIIHLESALCEALGTKHDDIDLGEALGLLDQLLPKLSDFCEGASCDVCGGTGVFQGRKCYGIPF